MLSFMPRTGRWALPPLILVPAQEWKYLSASFVEKEAGIRKMKLLSYGDCFLLLESPGSPIEVRNLLILALNATELEVLI